MADIKRICGEGMMCKIATVSSCSAANIKDGEGPLVFQKTDHLRDPGGKAELIARRSFDQ